MAFTFSDLNKINITAIADAISLTLGLAGEMENGLTVLPGVASKFPVLTFLAKDKAVRRSSGCSSTYKYTDVGDNVKYYDHAQIELPIAICLQDLWGKMIATGVHLSDDFSATTLAGFMETEILKVLEADMLRLAWLDGLKTSDTNGIYTVFKNGGFIKQMQTSAQTIKSLTPTGASNNVLEMMKWCIDDMRADKITECEFFVTPNVMRVYKDAVVGDKSNTMAQVAFEEGKQVYRFEGYKINELRHVGANAKADTLTVQSFIAFTPKTNIQLALEDSNLTVAPFIQDAKDRNYYSTTLFAADAMVAVPEFVRLATSETA